MANRKLVWDFDGVFTFYQRWEGADIINDAPRLEIKRALKAAKEKGFDNVVFSSRCTQEGGIQAIRDYLSKNEIEVDDIVTEKVPAYAYIDDRAINFNGDFDSLIYQFSHFYPYRAGSIVWKKIKSKKDLPKTDMRVLVTVEEDGKRYATEAMYYQNGECFNVHGEYPVIIAWAPFVNPFLG